MLIFGEHGTFYFCVESVINRTNRSAINAKIIFKEEKKQERNFLKFIFYILNADWLVVNTRVIFIGCKQGCDYSSQRVRLMLKSHFCKPMKLQYLPLITEDV